MHIAVLGAGVVGLTTTLELQKDFRTASVDLIADKFYNETTSFVAAGIFRPTSGHFGPTEAISRCWINDSYNFWDNLRRQNNGEEAGVKEISGYIFSKQYAHIVRNKYLESLVPIYRRATDDELKLCEGDWKYGSYFTTILTDPVRYLNWALKVIKSSGVNIVHNRVDSFEELGNKYDVIINCTGLGGKFLCGDDAIVPLRGQVSKVKAPWIKNFFYSDYDTYIIPSFDDVTLGGCRQYDSYNLEFDHYDYLAMKNRCEQMIPSLEKSELVGHKVGLRPHRITVRVEKEHRPSSGHMMKIVHNYGHGGYGVTTAPGTTINAVRLVRDILQERAKL